MTLPSFIIVGVAKAGTTSLYRYLDQHPQVFMSPVKETNYFACEDAIPGNWTGIGDAPHPRRFRIKTLKDYEALFSGVKEEIAIGEASPVYFCSPTAPQKIRATIRDVKIVVILRNPADRAFSGYMMRVRRGAADINMEKHLTPTSHHVTEGFYHDRLARYFDVFPKENIKICVFEEFKKHPERILTDLFEFVGVSSSFVPDTSVRFNSGAVPKIKILNRMFFHSGAIRLAQSILPKKLQNAARKLRDTNLMSPPRFPTELRAELLSFYREDIRNLETLLGRDLAIWV